MFLKRLSVGTLVTLLLVSCGNGKNEAPKQEAAVYPTAVVSEQNTTLESVYPAIIKGQEDIEIRPRVDGFIDAIYVDEGSFVKKGQALFKINSPQSEQALLSAQASVTSAQAAVNTAKLNVDRIRPLAEKGIVSKVQLETTENAHQSAIAVLAQAQAMMSQARAALGWTNVTSPVDGIVGSITFRQGSLVDKNYVLTTVANTSNVYVFFSLNEKDLMDFLQRAPGNTQAEKIKNMPEVSLILADGTTYSEKGKIETISGLVNTTTGSVNFRAEFPNSQGLLRSGTSGKVSIPRHLENVFVVPQKATFAQQDKVLIYKVQGDSVVQTPISVLPIPGGKDYAVVGGSLSSGDRIVVDDVITLRNGKKIKVQ